MTFQKFSKESGFKVLAMARLNQFEYSICLYLINCSISGLDNVITTEAELSSLIGYTEAEVRSAIESLEGRGMLKLGYGSPHSNPDIDSMRIGMQYDTRKWQFDFDKDVTSQDAVVFPFRRQGEAIFQLVNNEIDSDKSPKVDKTPTWRRVFKAFVESRSLDDDEIENAENAAKVLVETHPVDQVLLIIRHFSGRIPTLSLLASSWQHYQEIFEVETQRVDLLGARQKHRELDEHVRKQAQELLDRAVEEELTEEEQTVLNILVRHSHPRRQLFWAYQTRSRYPHLETFFSDNADHMLKVTNSGRVLNRGFHNLDDDK